MRAMAYDAYGSDEVLTLRELPDPKVGPGEVRIRVRRAGVNPVDWKVMAGGLDGLMDVVFPVVADFVGGVREVTMAVLAVDGRHASIADSTVLDTGGSWFWVRPSAEGRTQNHEPPVS